MQYEVTQLADTVFKFSLYVEKVGMSFNQFLVMSDGDGALVETGFRQYFPLLKETLEEICPISEISKIIIPHFEGDEMGALGEFLDVNNNIQVYGTPLCAFSLGDLFGISVNRVQDGQIIKHGKLKLRAVHIPQVHQWDAMVVIEEKTQILFSSDMFIQLGEGKGFIDGDARDEMAHAIRKTRYLPSVEFFRKALDRLEREKIKVIAPMHGKCINENIEDYFSFLRELDI
jgi:flavorubredoxin